MTTIEPEEIDALLEPDEERRQREVSPRDFRRPRRLGSAQRAGLEELVGEVLEGLSAGLGQVLGERVVVELLSLGELDAGTLFADADEPVCALSFEAKGASGWITWESAAAVSAVEALLGAGDGAPESRALSPLEESVLLDLLSPVAEALAESLRLEARGFTVRQSPAVLRKEALRATHADAHRIEIELSISRPAGTSVLRCYLPGILPAAEADARERPEAPLPRPAQEVRVELRARFAGCDVPLSDLLALEEGDVIPLEDRVGDPVLVTVAGKPYGRATLGTRHGRLAIQIEHVEEEPR